MEAARIRFGPILEWLFAAAFIAGALALGSILVSELGTVRPVMRVIAGPAPVVETPAAVPPRAVSVPMLLLDDGRDVRVGDRISDVSKRLGAASGGGVEAIEREAMRERLTRFYELAGRTFVLVFEASERNAEPRVAGIYLR